MSARRDPTNAEALMALYALQQSTRYPATPDSVASRNSIVGYRNGIRRENRKNSFRLYVHGVFKGCLECGKPIPSDSTGDHLLPRSAGGPEGAQNYVPLVRGATRQVRHGLPRMVGAQGPGSHGALR